MEETSIKLYHTQHNSMMIKAFATFFEKEEYLDVTFVCKDGKKVLASKLVLSCLSPFLRSLISDWEGNQEMVTLLLPEVDHNILKLIFEFVYEGASKLGENEYKEFKQTLQMLEIKLPEASVTERNPQSVPQNPPPPVAKLQKTTVKSTNSMQKESSVQSERRGNSGAVGDTSGRRASDPDDDPLNVPDFYYVQSTLTGQNAANRNQGGSKNVAEQNTVNTEDVEVKPDMEDSQEANDGSPAQQDGVSTRKRTLAQMNSENESRSDLPDARRSRSSAHNREESTDSNMGTRKRNRPHISSESENSSDVPSGTEQNKRGSVRKQSFTYIREDSRDFMVNDTVTPTRAKSKKT